MGENFDVKRDAFPTTQTGVPPRSGLSGAASGPETSDEPGSAVARPGSFGTASGADHRVDPAHAVNRPAEAHSESPGAQAQVETDTPQRAVAAALPQQEQELFVQASQLADHLRTQFAELERREQSLSEQLALLDKERRSVRLWVHQFEEELQEREAGLTAKETGFAQKLAECQGLVGELEEQEKALLDP